MRSQGKVVHSILAFFRKIILLLDILVFFFVLHMVLSEGERTLCNDFSSKYFFFFQKFKTLQL